jgi:hypothetical protein
MKRTTLLWILAAVAVLAMGGVTVWLGQTLLPPKATAETIGTIVPWYLTWGMIWMTMLIALILAINLVMVGMSPSHQMAVEDSEPSR